MPSLQSKLARRTVEQVGRMINQPGLPLSEYRGRMEKSVGRVPAPPGVTVRKMTVNGVPSERILPRQKAAGKVILYLHGGGYVICSPNTHRAVVSQIALSCRRETLLLDYRLAPEHPFPAALEDAVAGYRWLLENGTAPQDIAIGGDSAGGGLTLATALALREDGLPAPAALFLLSPWTDLTFSGDTVQPGRVQDPLFGQDASEGIRLVDAYRGGHAPDHPLISPLFADLGNLPPMLIQVGADEMLLSDSTRLAEKAQAAGTQVRLEVWPHMWHVWHIFAPLMPEANRAIRHIRDFLKDLEAHPEPGQGG